MTDTLPDRLCVDPSSRYYDEKLLARNIGIRFNGVERTNVEEYCISEGWIRSAVGKTLDRRGKPLTVQLKGTVEPFFKDCNPRHDAQSVAQTIDVRINVTRRSKTVNCVII